MNKFIFTLLLILSVATSGGAQDLLGIPQIVNYTNEQYNAGIQNWDIRQDKNGILYFGNNEGLLTFNGRFWNLYRLPNFTAVRSIEIAADQKIYVGAQDEIGYFYPDAHGILKFKSLITLLPEKLRKIADVWDISIVNDEVFFRSTTAILQYKDGLFKIYKPNLNWLFLGLAQDRIYAQSKGEGLMVYDKEHWKPYCTDEILRKSIITSVSDYGGDTLLISTLIKGFFLLNKGQLTPLKSPSDSIFYNDRVFFSTPVNRNLYAVATTSGGVVLMNKQGHVVQKFNYKEGLQNNNVRGVLLDHDQNMWLAMDDGIAYVAINSAIKNIFPDRNKQITSYAFRKFNDHFYIGTSNGLYATKLTERQTDLSFSMVNFKEVRNTKGQVWGLDEINGQLLMAHEEGVSTIQDLNATPVYTLPGTWMFQPMESIFPAKEIITGTYLGLHKVSYENGKFSSLGKIEGFSEALRFIAIDNNDQIWASHPYHGVYQISLFLLRKYILST